DELLTAHDVGHRRDQPLHALADAHRDRTGDDGAQVLVDGTDVGRDRHAVVVQDHDDVATRVTRVVHRLVRQAAGERAVAHHRDTVSSTTPSPAPIWPPVWDTTSISRWRTSSARGWSWSRDRRLTSSGPRTESSSATRPR